MDLENNNQKLTSEKARMKLYRNGIDVSLEEAEKILAFLRFIADINVKYFLNKEDEKSSLNSEL